MADIRVFELEHFQCINQQFIDLGFTILYYSDGLVDESWYGDVPPPTDRTMEECMTDGREECRHSVVRYVHMLLPELHFILFNDITLSVEYANNENECTNYFDVCMKIPTMWANGCEINTLYDAANELVDTSPSSDQW